MATKKAAKKTTNVVTKKTKRTAPKKQAVKKTLAKKAPKKVVARKPKSSTKSLVYAAEAERFWTVDGQILDSLVALNESLNAMEDAVFIYHARGVQNDFAQWVEFVLHDADCADALRRSRKKASAQAAIAKQLKRYSL